MNRGQKQKDKWKKQIIQGGDSTNHKAITAQENIHNKYIK